MYSSSFAHKNNKLRNISEGYRKGKVQDRYYVNTVAGGSLRSNVQDMATFAKLMLSEGGKIITENSIKEMWTRQNADVPLDFDTETGLAWFLWDIPTVGHVVGHGGGTRYFRSSLIISPELELAVIVLTNSTEGWPGGIANEMLKLAAETKRGKITDKNEKSDSAKQAHVSTNTLPLGGHYQTRYHGHVFAEQKGGRFKLLNKPIELRPSDQGGFSIFKKHLNIFWLQPKAIRDARYYFEQVAGEVVVIKISKDGTRVREGVKLETTDIPASWHSRLGRYKATSNDSHIDFATLEIDHNMLRLAFRWKGSSRDYAYALRAHDENSAQILGLGRGLGGILRATGQAEDSILNFKGLLLQRELEEN